MIYLRDPDYNVLAFHDLETGYWMSMVKCDTDTGYFEGQRITWNAGQHCQVYRDFKGFIPFDVVDRRTRRVVDKGRP